MQEGKRKEVSKINEMEIGEGGHGTELGIGLPLSIFLSLPNFGELPCSRRPLNRFHTDDW